PGATEMTSLFGLTWVRGCGFLTRAVSWASVIPSTPARPYRLEEVDAPQWEPLKRSASRSRKRRTPVAPSPVNLEAAGEPRPSRSHALTSVGIAAKKWLAG